MTFLPVLFYINVLFQLFSSHFIVALATATATTAVSTSSPPPLTCVKSPLIAPVLDVWLPLYLADHPEASVSCGVNSVGVSNNAASYPQVDILFTDVVLTNADYTSVTGSDLQMFPILMSPMVSVYNLPGHTDTITLTMAALAAIWAGNITNWSHNTLKALNPSITLPNQTITLIAYSGSHEYTTILTTMLTSISAGWKASFNTFSISDGFRSGVGNNANFLFVPPDSSSTLPMLVQSTPYSISFATLFDTISQGASFALMINKNGVSTFPFPQPAKTDMETATFTSRLTTSAVNMAGLSTYPLINPCTLR